MTTVFIANQAVTLPPRFIAGDILYDNSANLLQGIWLRRMVARLRWALDRGEIDGQTIQAKANELAALDLEPYTLADDPEDGEGDVVMQEALSIARGMITARMAAEGLPPPKGLDTHAKVLVDAMPDLVERARRRIEARLQVANAALEGMQ